MSRSEDKEIQRLRETLMLRDSQLSALQTERDRLQGENRVLRIETDLLKEQLRAQMRKLFGAKSEARGSEQKDLFFNEAEALLTNSEAAQEERIEATDTTATIKVPAHARKRPGRKPLDPALPRERIRHELPEAERVCAKDGAMLKEIGVEVSEQLDIIPQQVRVIRHERVKYACPCCDESIKVAPAPKRIIPKGLFSVEALAWIITAKYLDGLPLYRIGALLHRFGGDISRNTVAASVVRIGEALSPLIDRMRTRLLQSEIVLGDETELQVLKEPGRRAQTKSYLWVQISGQGPPIRLFTYAPSRSSATALGLYAGMGKGAVVLSDGYGPYEDVAHAYGLVHLGCFAHARRYFIEAEEALPKDKRTTEALPTQFIRAIAELYMIEAEAKDMSAEQRQRLRQEQSAKILKHIEALLQGHLHQVPPSSLLGKALHYLSAQWPKLIRYIDNGNYPIDNNQTENAIRPFVVGRKAWLFADTVGGAKASAALYSLLETAKANNVDPYRYLIDIFNALPNAKSEDDYERLLPWNMQQPKVDSQRVRDPAQSS